MKHDDLPALIDASVKLGVPLSGAQAASLLAFEQLLLERAVPAGMVAKADESRLRERHILDCLRAAAVVAPEDRSAYDLGSGAGLPGVVVAVVRPLLEVTLVETRRQRAAFLELVVERLSLPNAVVAPVRIEQMDALADLCFARALAPLTDAWAMAERLLRPEGRLVYFAGQGSVALTGSQAEGADIRTTPVLERSGSLVIMAR